MARSATCLTFGLISLFAVSNVNAQQFPKTDLAPEIRAVFPQLNDPTSLADPYAQLELLRELANLPAAPQGVVVMTDGRTFSGTIKELPGGYRVEFSGTYMMVPFEYALVTAATLPDAYIKLRENVPRHTAETRMKLAEWCRDQGLYQEAIQEVGTAINMEPLRSDARQLLSELQQHLPKEAKEALQPAQPPAMTADGFTQPNNSTSLGLSRDSMQNYIRHVQPLILNKCGNRGCHANDSPQSFLLTTVGGLVHQKTRSEENLASILAQISRTDPINSPLIRKPLETTPAHQSVFAGGAGRKQYALLTDWVQQVLCEQPGGFVMTVAAPSRAPVATPKLIQPRIQQASAETAQPVPVGSHSRPAAAGETVTADFLNKVATQQRSDPFDPNAFNRRVHGSAAPAQTSISPQGARVESAAPSPSAQRFSELQPLPSLNSIPR